MYKVGDLVAGGQEADDAMRAGCTIDLVLAGSIGLQRRFRNGKFECKKPTGFESGCSGSSENCNYRIVSVPDASLLRTELAETRTPSVEVALAKARETCYLGADLTKLKAAQGDVVNDRHQEINELLSRAFTFDRELEIPAHLKCERLPPLPAALLGYMEFHR
jgi:hypothetical protein